MDKIIDMTKEYEEEMPGSKFIIKEIRRLCNKDSNAFKVIWDGVSWEERCEECGDILPTLHCYYQKGKCLCEKCYKNSQGELKIISPKNDGIQENRK